MRTGRGRGKAAPSSPSVDALAAIAARKAAKIEKSLNKIPAMQLIADQLARENAMEAAQVNEAKMTSAEAPAAVETADMKSDENSDNETAASVEDDIPAPTQVHKAAEKEDATTAEVQQPSSVCSCITYFTVHLTSNKYHRHKRQKMWIWWTPIS